MGRDFGIKREALHLEGPTVGYSLATEIVKKINIVMPFLAWPLAAIAAAILHGFWPDNMYVLAFTSMVTVIFAGFSWYLSHDRKGMASEQAAGTVLAYGTLLALVDACGWTRMTTFLMVFGVFGICASWSMRNIIRHHDATTGLNMDGMFKTAGLEGTKMHIKPEPGTTRKRWSLWRPTQVAHALQEPEVPADGKVRRAPVTLRKTGKLILKPGETAENVIKKMGAVESAAGVPPGTFMVTKDMDNAGRANVVISDPHSIRDPKPYPGPSYVNASIADTISVGLYQDGTEVEFDILGLQIQIMGMIGSGKSLGAGWSALAEIITRKDAIVWGIDITKGDQTLGPLSSAIHRLATTKEDAFQILADANALIKPRTDYLSKKGLGKWRKGCGLKYLIVWIEEVPDVMEEIGDDGESLWIKSVKAARSAGISFVWSLQRADYSQIPTITRGQAVKWCFGVSDSHEASFGLSTVQHNAGCEPENWANRHPGKFYLDAPSIAEEKVPLAARAWYWGQDDSKIRAHAEQFPAADREPDEVMIKILSRHDNVVKSGDYVKSAHVASVETKDVDDSSDPRDDVDEVEEMITDTDLDNDDSGLSAGENDFKLVNDKAEPMPPEAARMVIRNWLVDHAGQTVKNADLIGVRNSTGYGRSWMYKIMYEMEASHLVRRVDINDGIGWTVTDLTEVLEGK